MWAIQSIPRYFKSAIWVITFELQQTWQGSLLLFPRVLGAPSPSQPYLYPVSIDQILMNLVLASKPFQRVYFSDYPVSIMTPSKHESGKQPSRGILKSATPSWGARTAKRKKERKEIVGKYVIGKLLVTNRIISPTFSTAF